MDIGTLLHRCDDIQLLLESVLGTLSNSDWDVMNEFCLKMAVLPILFQIFPGATIHSELRCVRGLKPGYVDVAVELDHGCIIFELKCMGLKYWEEHDNMNIPNWKNFVFYEKFKSHAAAKEKWNDTTSEQKQTQTFADFGGKMLNISQKTASALEQVGQYTALEQVRQYTLPKRVIFRIALVSYAASIKVELLPAEVSTEMAAPPKILSLKKALSSLRKQGKPTEDKDEKIGETFVPRSEEEKETIRKFMQSDTAWLNSDVDPLGITQDSDRASIWNAGDTGVAVAVNTDLKSIVSSNGGKQSYFNKGAGTTYVTWWSEAAIAYVIDGQMVSIDQLIVDDCYINLKPRTDKSGESATYGDQYVEIGIPVNAYKNILIRLNAKGVSADVKEYTYVKEDSVVWLNVSIKTGPKDDMGRSPPLAPMFASDDGDQTVADVLSLRSLIKSDVAGYYNCRLTLSLYAAIGLPIGTSPIDVTDIIYSIKFKLCKVVLEGIAMEVTGSFSRAAKEVY
jgi:hypothetical protein